MIAPKEPSNLAAGSSSSPLHQSRAVSSQGDLCQNTDLNRPPTPTGGLDPASMCELRRFFVLLDRMDRQHTAATDGYATEKRVRPENCDVSAATTDFPASVQQEAVA